MLDETPKLSEATSVPSLATSQRAGTELNHSRDFLWKVHGYINDYIRFADTKAAFCLGIAAALLGTLFSAKFHELFIKAVQAQHTGPWSAQVLTSTGAFIFLALSIAAAVTAVRPRFWIHSVRGFIFWEAIAEFDSARAFAAQFGFQSEQELNLHLARHLYSLAKVCRRKYFWVSVSVLTGVVGAVLTAVAVLLNR